ncbi:MAG: flagellar protein FlaG [Treponemataceae bacterium]
MQVKSVGIDSVNSPAGIVAKRAREINSTLKRSADKITESIEITAEAAQKLKEAQARDREYKNTLAATENIQKISDAFSKDLDFSVNKEINRVIVRVVDRSTNETVKEIPSQEVQNIQKRMQDLLNLLVERNN